MLHGVRLKGFAEPAVVSALWGLDEAGVRADVVAAYRGFLERNPELL